MLLEICFQRLLWLYSIICALIYEGGLISLETKINRKGTTVDGTVIHSHCAAVSRCNVRVEGHVFLRKRGRFDLSQ